MASYKNRYKRARNMKLVSIFITASAVYFGGFTSNIISYLQVFAGEFLLCFHGSRTRTKWLLFLRSFLLSVVKMTSSRFMSCWNAVKHLFYMSVFIMRFFALLKMTKRMRYCIKTAPTVEVSAAG